MNCHIYYDQFEHFTVATVVGNFLLIKHGVWHGVAEN